MGPRPTGGLAVLALTARRAALVVDVSLHALSSDHQVGTAAAVAARVGASAELLARVNRKRARIERGAVRSRVAAAKAPHAGHVVARCHAIRAHPAVGPARGPCGTGRARTVRAASAIARLGRRARRGARSPVASVAGRTVGRTGAVGGALTVLARHSTGARVSGPAATAVVRVVHEVGARGVA